MAPKKSFFLVLSTSIFT